MRLRQLKIRGVGRFPVTDWVMLSTSVTLLRFANRQAGEHALKAVQCLNPPFDFRINQPFKDLPLETVSANGLRRVIAPEKRTIVFGIFDTPSSLVKELGAISQPLYETDRVEVGRRLDYSRWINFVEIASSSRWSEVSEDIKDLLRRVSSQGAEAPHIHRLLAETAPTDRLKGSLAEQLATWLAGLPERDGLNDIVEKVLRASRFSEARAIMARRLPQFIALRYGEELQRRPHPRAGGNEPQAAPVLLIDCFDAVGPEAPGEKPLAVLGSLAKHCQCLCFADHSHPGWNLEANQIVDVTALN